MARFSLLPKEEQYFELFKQMSSNIFDAARALGEMLNDNSTNFAGHVKHIKDIEHRCDDLTHKISDRLNRSFITPFDREDIYSLSGALDDVVDMIDDAAHTMLNYHVEEVTDHARSFATVLQNMSVQLHEIVSMLEKPVDINSRLVEMHRLENEGDAIFFKAIAELFGSGAEPLTVIKWKDIYEIMEAAVDSCEKVSNIIESIVIKHT